MALRAINYDKTHFYKIVCKDTNIKDCYVGHTTDFTTRKCSHQRNSKKTDGTEQSDLYVYKFIRENGGWENWDMVLIETSKCDNGLQARQRERYFIETLGASLNKTIPFLSVEEKKERDHLRYKENIDRHNELMRDVNKRLRQEFPERYKEYDRQKWINNKEKIQAHQKEIIKCECGVNFQRTSKARHEKSKKHQQYLQSLNNPQE